MRVKIKRTIQKTRENFFRRFDNQKGISKELNGQLSILAVVGFLCNLFTWIFWLRSFFITDIKGSFDWYVLRPFIFQEIIVIISMITRKILDSVQEKNENFDGTVTVIIGSAIYTTYFMALIYFYKDVPIFWLFAVCPMLLTSLYRENKWFFATLAFTALELVGIILGFFNVPTYRINEVPAKMMATEAFVIAILVGNFTVALHGRITQAINDVAKAEATKQAKDAFFAKMSHEIRTPINAVLGMDEMILREQISPEVENYAVNIKNAGQSLLSIINDILDTSKLESGHMSLAPVEYETMNVLLDCYNMTNLRAKDKGLELRVTNDPLMPKTLFGDEIRIRQVVTNILTNAVKYTRVGFVDLSFAYTRKSEGFINMVVTVKDTGIGISPEGKEQLFKSFERLDEQKNKYVEGTGLGLAIAKSLTDLMEGTISVESVVDEGSTFTVIIPQKVIDAAPMGEFAKRLESLNRQTVKYTEKFTAPEAKVLVVDDVKMNIDVFRGLLKRTQVQIDSALSGREALKLIAKTKYDIIFLDHLMPEMDGVETLNQMREAEHPNKNTPVVAITANAGPKAEEEYLALGFDAYISKPVKGKILEEIMYKFLMDTKKGKDEAQDETPEEMYEKEVSKDFIDKLDFLDTSMGLSCCGDDEKLYAEIIGDYISDNRMDELNKQFEAKNWTEYRVQIHAVKSSSLSIGAIKLSNLAKSIEKSVIDEDYEKAVAAHPDFLNEYGEMLRKLKFALS